MEFDLTNTIAQYLDRHLIIPLLDFTSQDPNMEGMYNKEDVMRAKLDLLSSTGMIDYAIETHEELYNTPPPDELVTQREKVIITLQALVEEASKVYEVVSNDEVMAQLDEHPNATLETLESEFGISAEVLETGYEACKFQFDCGIYEETPAIMQFYRRFMETRSPERALFALWGKLAADILNANWEAGLEDINILKEVIDANSRMLSLNPLQQLQQRTWLIHWSLFVFFNHPDGRNGITDLLFNEKYLNTIQTNCPHILRYLTTAVITNKRRRNVMKDLVKVIQQESYAYSDPITEFVQCLYVNFDFEGAQDMLQKCEDTLKRDYFLNNMLGDFLEDARRTIFETYCRIHQVIDISMLANKLNMDKSEAEKWVVNLIRHARLDAKIDSQANQVIMGLTVPSVYEQVVDSTKNLLIRANALVHNCDRPQGTAGSGGNFRGDDERRGKRGGRRDHNNN